MAGIVWTQAFYAGGLGALSASALVAGALLGIYAKPTQKIIAAVMAFGSGALIAALALELASEAHEKGGFIALAAGFLGGGILYWSLNHVIESQGGFLRKRATRRRFILRHKEKQAKALTEQQDQRHLLRHLPRPLTAGLANHVQPRHYEPGEFIFKAGEKGDALFVINQGEVRLVGGANTAAEAAVDGALSQAWREVFGHKSAEKADVAPANDPSKLPADPKGRRFDPGETFGESALLTGRARSCSAVAETSVDALRLDRKALQQMVESSPRLALAVSRILAQRLGLAGQHEAELEAEVAHWRETPGHDPGVVTAAEEQALHEAHKANAAAPVAIFLGALLDGIPESLVIGAELVAGAAFNPTFVAAVFISNLPEAMSSAAGMKQAGFTTRRVMGLWTGLTVASAVASFLGNLLLAESNPALVAVVDAVAGGGILAMLASTMMPEAFEQGGPSVSLSTIAGFLAAFFFHTLGA